MARTAGSTPFVLGGLLVLAMARPVACDGGGKDGGGGEVAATLGDVLAAVGPEVVLPTLGRAHAAADGLVAATAAWAEDPGDGARQAAAQDAWRATMDVWQELEVMQLGPAAPALSAKGGEGLRDEVYSWPTVNPCRVDQETVAGEWGSPAFFTDELVNVYGLDALDTLLFSPAGVNACPGQVDINAEGTWDALGPDGVQQNRAAYAHALAQHVAARIAELEDRWDPAGGDFSGALARAGEPGGEGSPFESPEEGLNAVFDALFYLELRTQDDKLAPPLGLGDCVEASCFVIETPLAGGSHDWIEANVRGFTLLYTGGAGSGMDDLLRAVGSAATADAMDAALADAASATAALTAPLDRLPEGEAELTAAYDAIRAVTDLLEQDVALILALQIPQEAVGDSD